MFLLTLISTLNSILNLIYKKISSALFFIRQAKNTLPSKALTALYYSIIHCHLVYALPIWSCTSASNLKTIITKQKIAIRLISNSPYNEHTEPIFKRLNILPFSSLIEVSVLQFMQQSVQGFLPSSLTNEWESNENRRQDFISNYSTKQRRSLRPFCQNQFC